MRSVGIILANCKGNLGDFAILQAMIYHLRNQIGFEKIDIFTDPIVAFSDKQCLAFVERCPVSVAIYHSTPAFAEKMFYRRLRLLAIRLGIWQWINGHLIWLHSRSLRGRLHQFSNYNALMVAGGGLWGAHEETKFGLIKALVASGIPVATYPFTAAWPMWRINNARTLRCFFSLFSQPPLVRESLTKARFLRAGIPCQQVPDIAFYLKPEVQKIEAIKGVNNDRILFCVTKRVKVPKAMNKYRKRLDNITNNSFCATIERLLAKGIPVELITTCMVEDKEKLISVAERYSLPFHFPSTWQEFCSHAKSCAGLITNRLHGIILGMLSDAPVIIVTDSDKVDGFHADYPQLPAVQTLDYLSADSVKDFLECRNSIVSIQNRITESCFSELNDLVTLPAHYSTKRKGGLWSSG